MGQTLQQQTPLIRERMKSPRAAAVAGVVFSLLFSLIQVLLRVSVPMTYEVTQLAAVAGSVLLALKLVPLAGIAFLWVIGVVRNRIGVYQDRFFATLSFGSGILFLAMLFTANALAEATILTLEAEPRQQIPPGAYTFVRSVVIQIMNVYALKMAAVFMFSTATLASRTRILPGWITMLGHALAVLLLLSSRFVDWLALTFPLWVFILSTYILIEDLPATGVGDCGKIINHSED